MSYCAIEYHCIVNFRMILVDQIGYTEEEIVCNITKGGGGAKASVEKIVRCRTSQIY